MGRVLSTQTGILGGAPADWSADQKAKNHSRLKKGWITYLDLQKYNIKMSLGLT